MKIIYKILPFIVLVQLFIAHKGNLALGQNNTEIEAMRNYSHDMGSWIGIRGGVQTNGGNISERWTWSVAYEYRYSKFFSIPIELQFFNDRTIWWNGIEYIKYFETCPAMSVALKMRVPISKMNLFIQGGFQYIAGSGFYMRMPYYGAGFEIFFFERVSLYANIQKNLIPDYRHFLLIGVNVQITSFTK